MIERANRQTSPLIEGRFYLVPIVRGIYCGRLGDWPVIGSQHEDREIFQFPYDHYHVDPRFLPRTYRDVNRVFNAPLCAGLRQANAVLPPPVLRRRKCVRSFVRYAPPWQAHDTLEELRKVFAGRQCAMGKGGWVCPHRKASLGSIMPEGNIITCPLHGLRIDAASGLVLPADREA